ncbi:hypothetical protein B296_00024379 [Ensete ventricosum]|uniref:Uncharacterized protein n=1 Tax=Ensete ventricosum TaxID=4639 RepID=A0A426ZDL7_ENSVE|nr:hypothetical protein B296_00024379 [Ensete ventricosum]
MLFLRPALRNRSERCFPSVPPLPPRQRAHPVVATSSTKSSPFLPCFFSTRRRTPLLQPAAAPTAITPYNNCSRSRSRNCNPGWPTAASRYSCCRLLPSLATTTDRRPRAPSTVYNSVASASCYPCLPSLPSSSSSSAASAAPSATRSRSSSTLLQQPLPDINTTATHVAASVTVMLLLQPPLPIASVAATIASCASSSPYAVATQPSILHCTAAISAPHLSTRSLISNRSSHCFP